MVWFGLMYFEPVFLGRENAKQLTDSHAIHTAVKTD